MILETKLRIPYGTQAGSTSLPLKVQTNIEHMERGGTPGSFFPVQLFSVRTFWQVSRTLPLNPAGKACGSFEALVKLWGLRLLERVWRQKFCVCTPSVCGDMTNHECVSRTCHCEDSMSVPARNIRWARWRYPCTEDVSSPKVFGGTLPPQVQWVPRVQAHADRTSHITAHHCTFKGNYEAQIVHHGFIPDQMQSLASGVAGSSGSKMFPHQAKRKR